MLEDRYTVRGHPIRVCAAVQKVAHLLNTHADVSTEAGVQLVLAVEAKPGEPVHDGGHCRDIMTLLLTDCQGDQGASRGDIVCPWGEQVRVCSDNPLECIEVARRHRRRNLAHYLAFPGVGAASTLDTLGLDVPARRAVHARHGEACISLRDRFGEHIVHSHAVESRDVGGKRATDNVPRAACPATMRRTLASKDARLPCSCLGVN